MDDRKQEPIYTEYTLECPECGYMVLGEEPRISILCKPCKEKIYKPTATLKDYKEAIQILMVDYADVWEKTGTFKEVNKKLKKLGI